MAGVDVASIVLVGAMAAFAACGGKAHDVRANDNLGNVGGADGGIAQGGFSGDGAIASGGSGAIGGGSTTGSGGAPADSGTACPVAWWGGTFDGVRGLLECSEPYDPAILAYGQLHFSSCWVVTGPTSSTREGENLECCYLLDEGACGTPYTTNHCVDVPYFGDGSLQVQVPDAPVSAALAACNSSRGALRTPTTQAERASLIMGAWVLCEPMSPPFDGATGIVFYADGTFHTFTTDENDRLVAAVGCDVTGLWGFISNPNQLNLYHTGGTSMTSPMFFDGPPPRVALGALQLVRLE